MMAIVNSYLPFPNLSFNPGANVARSTCNLAYKRPVAVAASSASWPQTIDVEHLESEFRSSGVSFTGIGNSCVVRMELDNGSTATLMLPSGLITSFKPQMWHGATMELLHTFVSENGASAPPAVLGGLSLSLSLSSGFEDGVSWSPDAWALHQVNGTREESMQVELISTSEGGNARVKQIITLKRDVLNSEILVSNSSTSSLKLMGSAMCHLGVSTPDATYAIGLQGSNYFTRPPFQPNFSIVPPDFLTTTDQRPAKSWPFNKLFPKWDARNQHVEELEGEEDDNYKHLTEKMSRVYTSAPRSLTIMDRGRRNSVTLRRHGFEEVYMLSPGSEHEWYKKYSYVCVGHAALLEPVTLNAQSEWRGGLQLWNPNS